MVPPTDLPYGSTPTSIVTTRAVKMDEGEDDNDDDDDDDDRNLEGAEEAGNSPDDPPVANLNPIPADEKIDWVSESILW